MSRPEKQPRIKLSGTQSAELLRGFEDRIRAEFQGLRDVIDKYQFHATVVPNVVSAARSGKVMLEHIRAAVYIADDID